MSNSNQPIEITECITLSEDKESVRSVQYSPDGKKIVSGGSDKLVKVWNIDTNNCILTLYGNLNKVLSVSWSPDGEKIVSGSFDNSIRVWNANSGNMIQTIVPVKDPVTGVAFNPINKGENKYIPKIVSCGYDNFIRVFNVNDSQELMKMKGYSHSSIDWSPDGNKIVAGSYGGYAFVWDAKNGNLLFRLEGHSNSVNSVSFSPDSSFIVSSSTDTSIKIWDAITGNLVFTLIDNKNKNENLLARSVSWSPDGSKIAAGFSDYSQLWDINTKKCIAILKGHTKNVNTVAWSPDSCQIASGSDDGTIKIWNVSSLKQNLLAQTAGKKQGKKATLKKEKKIKKLIDTYKKSELVKIAKMHEVSLKTRDDKVKTKLQLFNSLKRKKLL